MAPDQTVAMTNLKTIGARVRDLRLTEGIGQQELASIIGISRSTLAGIETGIDRGGIETMIAIADHYKVPMDWLLDRKVPPGPPPLGKFVYRSDEVSILGLWEALPIHIKKALRDWVEAQLPPGRVVEPVGPVGPVELRRRVRRKSTASA
jgi:transcriptional regulator with XRE-family HTH domain